MQSIRASISNFLDLGVTDDLDDNEAMNRRIVLGATAFQAAVAPGWVVFYALFDELLSAAAASMVTIAGVATLVGLKYTGQWTWFRRINYAWWFFTAFALMASLGGFALGSAVIIWAVFGPLMAILEGRGREAIVWVSLYIVTIVAAGAVQPLLRDSNNLPEAARTSLFVLDLAVPSLLIFLLLAYFVKQQRESLEIMVRNRELEATQLQQELQMRQNDKLATLGKLSAGPAPRPARAWPSQYGAPRRPRKCRTARLGPAGEEVRYVRADDEASTDPS